MNSAILLIPIFLIRYVLPRILNKSALNKLAFFPKMVGIEKIMYLIYEVSTILIVIFMFFLKIDVNSKVFKIGFVFYILGLLLFSFSTFDFSKEKDIGISKGGLYKLSRNPMYVSYFICFVGCAMVTNSLILFSVVVIFQISAYWIILSEERWCVENFGKEYIDYMKRVRRYI